MASKAVLYSAALYAPARRYVPRRRHVVLGDLIPVVAALDAMPDDLILACPYCGEPGDVAAILGADRGEGAYPLVVNDGLFAGSRRALLRLDAAIRSMPGARGWLAAAPHAVA